MPGVTAHVALDALLLALCALGFFPSAPSRRALLFPPVCAAACVVGRWFSSGLPESDLLLLPVGGP